MRVNQKKVKKYVDFFLIGILRACLLGVYILAIIDILK
tara:strand:- start:10 stop:123 length:114 start_codon:yes stop_codon:yes gene_type:complete